MIRSVKTGRSVHIPHGVSVIENGPFKGKTLADLWRDHQELFGHSEAPVFPLLIKILDAEDDLSVQVHPDDAYGMEHEGELGKTECWYIIDAEPGAERSFMATTHKPKKN